MDVREKLVELLNEVQETGVNEIPAGFGCTREYIKNEKVASHLIANGVTVQEWISVKDRLPHKNMRVLACYTFDGYMQFVQVMDYYATDKKPHFQHEGDGMRVTHWMPMPQPPKGE